MLRRVIKRMISLLVAMQLILNTIPGWCLTIRAATTLDIGVSNLTASYENGTWSSPSAGKASGTAKTSVSSGCTGNSYTAVTSTLTLTYGGSMEATLSFDYEIELNGGSIKIDSAAVTSSASFTKTVAQGDTVSVVLTSDSANENTTRINLTGIRVIEKKDVSTTFLAPVNGSYKVDGETISADVIKVKPTTETYALAATASSGYKFVCWYDETAGKIISNAASYALSRLEDSTVKAVFEPASAAIWRAGNILFSDLNSAVSYASSSGLSVVSLLSSGTLTAGNYVIPSGITVLIPFDDANTIYRESPEVIYGTHTTPSAFRKLTMASGAAITVESGGTIAVPSKLSAVGQNASSWNGTPTGAHGRIDMNSGSSITLQSGGKLYCYGYIAGSGNVTAKSGAVVYETFQIRDWRGGTATSGMGDNNQKVFPILMYYVQNIETPVTFEKGAVEYVFTAVNASSQAFTASTAFIGSGGLFSISLGSITRTYQGASDRILYDIRGDVSVNNMSLRITGLPLIGTLDLDSSTYVLPINSNITIQISSGSATVNQDLAFLPGTIVNVASGAALNVASGKKVYVYDQDQWGDYAAASAKLVVVGYSAANGTEAKRTAASLVDARIDVNGSLVVSGELYTTASGAEIISSEKTGTVRLTAGSQTATYQALQSGTDITYDSIAITSAKLQNADGSYTETTGASNTTYSICPTCGKWQTGSLHVLSFNANGGQGTMTDQKVCSQQHALSENLFTQEEYEFAGWNTSSDGTGTSYEDKQQAAFTTDTVLYAQWRLHVHDYQITAWHWNGYSAASVDVVCSKDSSHTATLPAVITEETISQPTCTTAGQKKYTATAAYQQQSFTDVKNEELPATGHDWNDPTYEWSDDNSKVTASRTCNNGNHPETETVNTTSEVTKQPTCTEKGETTYTATFTNPAFVTKTKTVDNIDALGHKPGEEKKENEIPATCTEAGSYDLVVRCTVCGEVISTEHHNVEALGHDWSQWTQTKDPTCTEPGEKERTCSRCHEKETETIQPLGHNPGEAVKENETPATCTESGSYDLVTRCTRCNEIISSEHHEVEALGHDWSQWIQTKDPTCTEPGERERTCSRCNEKETEVIDAAGHQWSEWEITTPVGCETDGERTRECTVCHQKETETIKATGHDWNEPEYTWSDDNSKVTASRTCNNGNHPETETVNTTSEVTKQPTCTEKGETTYTAAFTNPAFVTKTKTVANIDASGHNSGEAKKENEIPATCTEAGSYDLVVRCTICGEVISTEHHNVEALGHDWSQWIQTKDPTCTETGSKERTCSRCGEKQTETIPALGHEEDEAVKENETAPTCETAGGYDMVVYCSVCHEELSRTHTEIPATGHDWNEPTYEWSDDNSKVTASRTCNNGDHPETETVNTTSEVTKRPTCTEKGETTYTVAFANPAFSVKPKTVADIEALGHNPGEAKEENEIPATCTEAGSYDLVTRCTRCNEIISSEHHVVEALGHQPSEQVKENEVPATCTEAGSYDLVVRCTRCNEIISSEHHEVEPLGHDWSQWEQTKDPTCREAGEKERTCSRCHEKETETVQPLGHNPGEATKENEVPATCTEAGSYDLVTRCTRCNEILSSEHHEVEALGHDWGQWVEIRPASCTQTGEKERICSRCHKKETEVLAALGHSFTHYISNNNADFDHDGTKTATCDRGCGAKDTVTDSGSMLVARSIEMLSLPNKTEYHLNEPVDLSGARIRVTTTSGKTVDMDVTKAMISGFDSSKEGTCTVTVTFKGKTTTFKVTIKPDYLRGDFNIDKKVTDADAIYLLMNTFFADDYPLNQPGDFNKDKKVTDADAVYLLMYTFFPGEYPLD